MIVAKKNGRAITVVRVSKDGVNSGVIVVGTDPLDCARHAGKTILKAVKTAEEVSWNLDSGNEITLFRDTKDHTPEDKYIHSCLVTLSEKGRRVEHARKRRLNPEYEGLVECGLCHKRVAGTRRVYSMGRKEELEVCRRCAPALEIANDVWRRHNNVAAASPRSPSAERPLEGPDTTKTRAAQTRLI